MNEAEVIAVWKRAKNLAIRNGFGEEADDFAQEAVFSLYRGRKATLKQLLCDYVDYLWADKRVLGSPSGKLSKNRTASFDAPSNATESGALLHDRFRLPGPDVGNGETASLPRRAFKNDQHYRTVVMKLMGYQNKEIGNALFVSESRAGQIVAEAILKADQFQEAMEALSVLPIPPEVRRWASDMYSVKNGG